MAKRVHVEELETSKPLTRELKVTVQEDALRRGLEKAAKRVSRQVRIPGFRPGRAPYPIVERFVGREYLVREFLADELEGLAQEALQQVNIEETSSINLLDIDFQQPSFRMEVALPPRVELGDYMSIRIPYEPPVVTDEDVDKLLNDILRSRADVEEVEGPVEEEDSVDVVLTITVGDKTVVEGEEITAEMGAELFLPGLSDHLLGAHVGDVLEFTLPVPEEHSWREHGEEAQVTARIERIRRLRIPELTLELAQELNPEVESVEELRQIVRENLQAKREEEAIQAHREQVLDKIMEISTVEIPPLMVEQELDAYIEDLKQYASDLGLTWENYLRAVKLTEEEIREQHRAEVEETLRRDLVLETIAQEHEIKATDEALNEVMMYYYRQGISVEDIDRRLRTDQAFRRQFIEEAFRTAVLNFLSNVARGELEETTGAEETQEEAEEETEEEVTREEQEEEEDVHE